MVLLLRSWRRKKKKRKREGREGRWTLECIFKFLRLVLGRPPRKNTKNARRRACGKLHRSENRAEVRQRWRKFGN
eukprot:2959983-Alexandrium_andersonii.AAC.1